MTAVYVPDGLQAAIARAEAFSGRKAALQVMQQALFPPFQPVRQVDGTIAPFVIYDIKDLWRALISSYPHFINSILTWLKSKLTGRELTTYMIKWLIQQPAFLTSEHYDFSLVTETTAHLVPGEVYKEFCRRKEAGLPIDKKFKRIIKRIVHQDGRLAERFDWDPPTGNLMWLTHENVLRAYHENLATLRLTYQGLEAAIQLPIFSNPACAFIGLSIAQYLLGKDSSDFVPGSIMAGLVSFKKIKYHRAYYKLKRPKALEMPKLAPPTRKSKRKLDE